MKKINFYIFTLITILFFASCGKDGANGPAGATGPAGVQGAVGPAGPTGANGQNGSIIYSGTTVPATATGVSGDFYLNTTTGLLYGPKTASGWGTGISLKGTNGATGATGATGTPGSKIYNGSGAPTATTGINGDYYLDITNYLLYGPKTAGSWGVPVNLRGPAGPQGPEGNANVKTDVFSVTSANWLWNSQYEFQTNPSSFTEYFTRYYVRSNNSITQDVLDNGMVLVYFTPNTSDNNNQWAPLPYQFTDASGNFNYNIVFETSPGSVKLHYFFVQTNPTATIPSLSSYTIATYKFKIVSVTGKTGVFMLAHHINLNNYQEVSKVTGLWQQDNN